MKYIVFSIAALSWLQLTYATPFGKLKAEISNGSKANSTIERHGLHSYDRRQSFPGSSLNTTSGNSTNAKCPGYIDGFGISYSPTHADQSFKNQDEVNVDFNTFSQTQKYSVVRLYGSDGHQTAMAMQAAKQHGMQVMAAVYNISEVAMEIQRIITDVNGDWDMIHTVDVGNEVINKKEATVNDVATAVQTARNLLKRAGYKGCVVAIDVFDTYLSSQYQQLCEISDYVAANAHGYFSGTFPGSGDGTWLSSIHDQVKQACGGRNVTITETGWPTAGDPNNQAQPGTAAQQDALSSIKGQFQAGNVIFFEYEDDAWKANQDNPMNIEQNFGMYKKGYNPLVPAST